MDSIGRLRTSVLLACLALYGCSSTEGGAIAQPDTQSPPATPDTFTPSDVTDEVFDEADVTLDPCAGLKEGDPCDDDNLCTLDDRCTGGICVGATSLACDEEGPCRLGECDPDLGCTYRDADEGQACQVACFTAASCIGGVCEADPESGVTCPSPDIDEPCVLELRCEASTGACTKKIYQPIETSCDSDENLCTLEACDGQGTCVDSGAVLTCESAALTEPCWTFECQPVSGDCIPQLFVEGNSCDDGNPCTAIDLARRKRTTPRRSIALANRSPSTMRTPARTTSASRERSSTHPLMASPANQRTRARRWGPAQPVYARSRGANATQTLTAPQTILA